MSKRRSTKRRKEPPKKPTPAGEILNRGSNKSGGFTGGRQGSQGSSRNTGERDASTSHGRAVYVPVQPQRPPSTRPVGDLGLSNQDPLAGVGGYMGNVPGVMVPRAPSTPLPPLSPDVFSQSSLYGMTPRQSSQSPNLNPTPNSGWDLVGGNLNHPSTPTGNNVSAGVGFGFGGDFWGGLLDQLRGIVGPVPANQAPSAGFSPGGPTFDRQIGGNTGERDASTSAGRNPVPTASTTQKHWWEPDTTTSSAPGSPMIGAGLLGGLGDFLGGLAQGTQNMSDKALFEQVPKAPVYTPQTYEYQPVQLPDYKPFEFKQNDFTAQADAAATKAYGPQFAMIDRQREEATSRNAQQDELVQGIGSQLLQDLAKAQGTRQNTLTNAATAATNAGNAQAAQEGQAYTNTTNDLAALMAKYGSSVGMGNQLSQVADDSLTRQGEARQAGADTAKGYNQQSVDAGKYADEIDRATALQTASDRQDLMSQLSQAMYGYDQSELGVESDRNLNAQQMAQQLGDRDWQFQQANASEYDRGIDRATQIALADAQGRQQAGLANTSAANEAAMANATAQYNAERDAIQARQAARTQEIGAQAAAAEAAQAQANADRDYELRKAIALAEHNPDQAAADLALTEAQTGAAQRSNQPDSGAAGGLTFNQLPQATQLQGQAATIAGSVEMGNKILDYISRQATADPTLLNKPQLEFMQKVVMQAAAAGLDPHAVSDIAGDWWKAYGSDNPIHIGASSGN